MKTFLYILIIILIYLILDYVIHNKNKKYFDSIFPKNILANLDETIELPDVKKLDFIPKKIYRTHNTPELINKFKDEENIIKNNNKDFEIINYTSEERELFIKDNFSERVYNSYMNINPSYGPAKADFFRYLIIYYYGGVYLDIKSYTKKNINPIIDNENKLIVSKGRKFKTIFLRDFGLFNNYMNSWDWSIFSKIEHGEYNNWHFASPPGNIILKKVIQQMISNIEYGVKTKNEYIGGEYSVLVLTGPIMFSRIIKEYYDDKYCKIFDPDLNYHVKYRLKNHKNKNHYSRNKEKNILIT